VCRCCGTRVPDQHSSACTLPQLTIFELHPSKNSETTKMVCCWSEVQEEAGHYWCDAWHLALHGNVRRYSILINILILCTSLNSVKMRKTFLPNVIALEMKFLHFKAILFKNPPSPLDIWWRQQQMLQACSLLQIAFTSLNYLYLAYMDRANCSQGLLRYTSNYWSNGVAQDWWWL
jgi:hypothetical protein